MRFIHVVREGLMRTSNKIIFFTQIYLKDIIYYLFIKILIKLLNFFRETKLLQLSNHVNHIQVISPHFFFFFLIKLDMISPQ